MSTTEEIKKDLKELIGREKKLIKLASDTKNTILFGHEYQSWYTIAYKLVEALAPDRLTEFVSYYLIDPKRKVTDAGNYVIQDYIKAIGATED